MSPGDPTRSPFQFPALKPYVEPPPGDPDGPWGHAGTEIARGMQIQHELGWEFTTTSALEGEPFDPDKPPAGDGWVVNEYKGDQGHEVKMTTYEKELRVTYWRRRTPKK